MATIFITGSSDGLGRAAAESLLDQGHRVVAASEDSAALVTGRYWHHLAQQQPAREATDPNFQDALIEKLEKLTGVELPVM
jgi:NAD(P)-dependent dehydrogenase (short-subunit alcohol dehydrogenase family)